MCAKALECLGAGPRGDVEAVASAKPVVSDEPTPCTASPPPENLQLKLQCGALANNVNGPYDTSTLHRMVHGD
jgi:hypothetical protein